MKKALYIVTLFMLCFAYASKAQKVENVDFSVSNGVLTVTYDLLNGAKDAYYDLKLTIKTDSADLEPKSINGDITYVTAGKGKKIEWQVLKDRSVLQGKIRAIVAVVNTHTAKIKGGPACAFLSAVLPGLGDQFVNPGSSGYIISAAFISLVSSAIYYNSQCNNAYANYHSATDQANMDAYYNSASSYRQRSQIFLGAAAAIWAADIIYVAVKGFKNKAAQRKTFEENSKKARLTFIGTPNAFQIGFVKKF